MKIPKSHFIRFQKEFKRRQQLLGLTNYRACFEQKNMPGNYAHMKADETGQIALIQLATEGDQDYVGPEHHAKHEVIHLLTHRLYWLATDRYATEDEINREWEALVRRLEKVLK